VTLTVTDQAGNTGQQTLLSIVVVRPDVPGDLDNDYDVDAGDYAIFRSALGSRVGNPNFIAECDYDGDGRITLADYRIWYGYYKAFQTPVT
jgi:hypothetical protein